MSKWGSIILLIAGPAVPFIWSGWLCAHWSDALRWAGMWYQLAGLATVVWGLNERPEAFGLATLGESVGRWFAKVRDRILRRPPPPIELKGEGAAFGTSFGRAQLKLTGTPEERLDRLEDQLYRLACELDDAVRKIEKQMVQRFDEERLKRERAIADLKSQAVRAALGNTTLDLLGVVLISAGIIFSALAY
jgi:hypothetical protein